jgi:hypothetical protein
LTGKTALVTGAAKRLGRAIALSLAHEGVGIVLHYRSSGEAVKEVAGAVRGLGVKAWTLKADLAPDGEAESLVERAIDAAGPLDFLINNASVFAQGRLTEMRAEDVRVNVDVNALAPFAAARRFAGQGREGVVLNLLDARIVDYDREHAAYHLSKRMLFDLTRMMALEFAPSVRVNAIAPGLILPPEGEDERYLASLAHTNPLNRHGAAADIASAALFLLKSDFVTGQVVFVDGGRHLRGNVYGC